MQPAAAFGQDPNAAAASMMPVQPAAAFGMPAAAPAAPAVTIQVYDKNGLSISFMLEKVAGAPTKTKITSTFTNSSPVPMTDLLFQCAVPKYITLAMSPASGNMVPPNRSATSSQVVNIENTLQGQKGVMMRMKIQFQQNGQVIDDMAQVSNFPAGM